MMWLKLLTWSNSGSFGGLSTWGKDRKKWWKPCFVISKELCVDHSKVKINKVEDWIPSQADILKFNVDGSVIEKPGSAGIGGVLRDLRGKVLFSYHMGILDSNGAELWAIKRAIELIISNPDFRDREIWVVSDSKVAVSWVNINSGFGNYDQVHNTYDIQKETLPRTYLGLPLGARPSTKAFWNSISQCIQNSLFTEGSTANSALRGGLEVVIGDGRRSVFLETSIDGNGKLRKACLRIFTLSSKKHGVFQEFGRWNGLRWGWEVPLRRYLFNWEKDQWRVFLNLLDCICICKSFYDALVWKYQSDGKFTVGSFRKKMVELQSDNALVFTGGWQGVSSLKVELFGCQLLRGRLMVGNVMLKFD
ncbi:hypothetical protein Ddye_024739 [Dipteronia dyeriana]|uniref:RNase H type-1 domain-containing protein n=1 Tax=Dipteronia dyeriana TaxID=168575 RepID=A0AAD9WTW9_9ROSI|nr:hypothetical protein Ddye_024739 [Dipteronia dyeriana]